MEASGQVMSKTQSVDHDGVFWPPFAPSSLLHPHHRTESDNLHFMSKEHLPTAPIGAEGWVLYSCRCDECRKAYYALGETPRERRRNGPTPPKVHGTWNGYSNYGCRCQACLDACRETYDYAAGWRKANRVHLNQAQRARRNKKRKESS